MPLLKDVIELIVVLPLRNKMNIKYITIIILIPAYILLGYILSEECAAQNVKAVDNAGRDYFTVNSDIQTYQIIFKEHGKEYLTYYEALREKIIQKLKNS